MLQLRKSNFKYISIRANANRGKRSVESYMTSHGSSSFSSDQSHVHLPGEQLANILSEFFSLYWKTGVLVLRIDKSFMRFILKNKKMPMR